MILEYPMGQNRYSRSFLNLKSVIELEQKEEDFNLPKEMIKEYEQIEKQFYNFINNIPLTVVERYYNEHKENMNKYVYLEYNENELSELKISELLYKLEEYFMVIYNLAVNIASYYNIEIKLNINKSDKEYV